MLDLDKIGRIPVAAAVIVALSAIVVTAPARADFDRGLRAYKSGDYAEALSEWRDAAESGDAKAQYRLGTLYEDGVGTVQNLVDAWYWYELAATGGFEVAVDARDSIAMRLTDAESVDARARVDRFRRSQSRDDADDTVETVVVSELTVPRRALVTEIQTLLGQLGYVLDQVDGVVGSQTRSAIVAFQTTSGLEPDGKVSEALLTHLVQAVDTATDRSLTTATSATLATVDPEPVSTSVGSTPADTESESGQVPDAGPTSTRNDDRRAIETASIPSTLKSKTEEQGNAKIAIFPVRNGQDDRFFGGLICEEVLKALEDSDRSGFELTFASQACQGADGVTAKQLPPIDSKALWKRRRLDFRLAGDQVAEVGRGLGVDVVLVFIVKEPLSWENPGAASLLVKRAWLVDTSDSQMWKRTGKPAAAVQGASEIPQIVHDLLREYRRKHP